VLKLGVLLAPATGDRQATVAPEGQRGDLGTGGELTTLPLGTVNERDHAVHDRRVKPGVNQICPALGAFDIAVEDRVEQLVRGQRVLIDLVRTEGLPKNLRDDYTAFSLANIGYVMLHTTALAAEDQEVADLAHQHFRDYTDTVIRLNNLIPAAVVRFLEQQGLPVRADIVSEVNQNVAQAWKQTSDSSSVESVSARRL